jgi:hypothetical protein
MKNMRCVATRFLSKVSWRYYNIKSSVEHKQNLYRESFGSVTLPESAETPKGWVVALESGLDK